ncbi:MAG: HAD-IB family phosphatase [Candidatus Pacebacteria bacterium]|nr:HAD-IB family phosphatase [Candidatus Paceibacterota bacterium]
MKKVAVFDIDGTIFRSSLLIELVEAFIREEVFPPDVAQKYENEYRSWFEREGGYEEYINAVVRTFRENIKGVHYGILSDVSKQVVDEQKKRVYRYTRDLVAELKQEGYFLLAISQSPKTTVDPFCTHLGFDKVYGRIYEIGPQDLCTGEVTDEHLIMNKANIFRRAVAKEGLTLEGSVAVGDTESDIPILEAVERPICFNPNNNLYRHAKRLGWEVVVERKDVIYTIS